MGVRSRGLEVKQRVICICPKLSMAIASLLVYNRPEGNTQRGGMSWNKENAMNAKKQLKTSEGELAESVGHSATRPVMVASTLSGKQRKELPLLKSQLNAKDAGSYSLRTITDRKHVDQSAISKDSNTDREKKARSFVMIKLGALLHTVKCHSSRSVTTSNTAPGSVTAGKRKRDTVLSTQKKILKACAKGNGMGIGGEHCRGINSLVSYANSPKVAVNGVDLLYTTSTEKAIQAARTMFSATCKPSAFNVTRNYTGAYS